MRHHGFDEPILFKRLTLNSKLHENENKNKLTLINLSYFFLSILITVTQIIFWDCRVLFQFLLFFPTTFPVSTV